MIPGLFIISTSGSGGTLITSAIASALRSRSHDVAVMKPFDVDCPLVERPDAAVEVGGMPGRLGSTERAALDHLAEIAGPAPSSLVGATPRESLFPADAARLRRLAARGDDLDTVCPYRFAGGLEPAVVARLQGIDLDLASIMDCFRRLKESSDILLVDCSVGLMAPISGDRLSIDLALDMGLPALLVGPSTTGVISDCLLAIHALEHREIPMAGVVLCRTVADLRPEEAANPYQIEVFSGPLIRGVFPYIEDQAQLEDPAFLAHQVKRHIDLEMILNCLE